MAAEYEGTVEQVHQAFRDEQYWLQRLAGSGADEATLDSMTADDAGGVDVITTQTLRSDRLPAVVAQFHHGDLSFVRTETWAAITDGRATAAVAGSIAGAPVSLAGTAVLMPAEGGSRLEFKVTVEVRIPLVGGKMETFIGSQLVDLVMAEQRFTSAWIRENA
ncbi:MAG: hypothetical protein JWP55_2213 [Mycobacterium sp.]|nr:hypothetical protein [Mycobacterium sp.]